MRGRKERSMKRRGIIPAVLALAAAASVFGASVFLKNAYVIPVIMYHSIDYNDRFTKLSVSPESFERQMKFLRDRRYNVIGLDKVVEYMQKKQKIPPRTIAVTFDDGFYNNYEYAYPVLKRYHIPATFFIIVKMIGEPGYLGWKEIREMSDSGLVTIGSHSVSHIWMPAMGAVDLERELRSSKETLENALGRKVDAFCYPIGAHNDRIKKAAAEAGYLCAVTTNPGRTAPSDDVFGIKRIKISRTSDSLLVFWAETSGFYTWVKEQRDD
jgi:peptidoglycan/xylan/chitin deacetylase (PgdA/CDA1 family)